jgi:glycosyltransferase involved in cell wall biosynthesis
MRSLGAVVCTLNSEASIEACLRSLIDARIDQIVIVDGGSTDRTIDIFHSLGLNYLTDPGKGLGLARNIGVKALHTDLALIVGSDNIFSVDTIDAMKQKLGEGFLGVSCRTKVVSQGYLSFCLNSMWAAKIRPGKKNYIGTPQLFERKLLIDFPFSLNNSFSDDTELCSRLVANLNGSFFTVPNFCEEIGKSNFVELRKRYQIYGLSDWEIYSQNRETWGLGRKLFSLLHPLRTEFLTYIRHQSLLNSSLTLPILLYVTFIRYQSWMRKSIRTFKTARLTNSK